MRLTGGHDRGRRLKAPRGLSTRPTAAKVREAIFNILGPPGDAAVLDLFAGTGALGLEALSRGAPRATFVDRDRRAITALRRNLEATGLAARAEVLACDVREALRRLSGVERFGWVFVDPPYASTLVDETLRALDCRILAQGGVVIVEHDHRHEPIGTFPELHRTDLRYYGDTGLSFYRCHGGMT
jgi:16S rRNA (guanine966-N2)-methyltransferase